MVLQSSSVETTITADSIIQKDEFGANKESVNKESKDKESKDKEAISLNNLPGLQNDDSSDFDKAALPVDATLTKEGQ
eukprot:CAMPEP_0116984744 /NCGR_PEP_ID=MMETSP0467-20121206/61806_1 /TAXON_ID=283647 /ORGANISM="Mesodinium pulex, Strain SPMC105" /LENGTH=77 /DNA_ID=CAMNT_0004679857 /DNA_START=935 /DNA_END=1168 /DNA_ORIENTATION=+